jgi:hypothetical protein
VVAAEYEQYYEKLVKLKVMKAGLVSEHGEDVFAQEAQMVLKAMSDTADNLAPYFITSFCVHDEGGYEYSNGLLSQWRSYALGGFAIEFDEFGIDALNEEEKNGWSYQGLFTDNVAYDNHEARLRPERFKGMAGALLRATLGVGHELDDTLGKATIGDFAQPFLSVAPFLKHEGFRHEAEYRIVAMCLRATKHVAGDPRKLKQIRFRSRPDGNVVPYVALYDEIKKPLPIKAVIIGPHAQQENQRKAVELLLEQNNLNAAVRLSELPFRE